MSSKTGILFYGDPHGHWQPLLDEYARQPAKAVVLLGDCELDRPLLETLEPISTDGCPIHWIYGNHDNHTDEQWANLTSAPNGLHGRVTDVAGVRIAGLGGNYAAKIWYPKVGNEEPQFRTRREFLRSLPRSGRPGTLPLEAGRSFPRRTTTCSGSSGLMCWSATRHQHRISTASGRLMSWRSRSVFGWWCTAIITGAMSVKRGTVSRCAGWGLRSAGG